MASTYEALLLAQVGYLMNNTQQLLQTQVLSAPAASVPLTVPPGSTYNSLKVVWRARSVTAVTAEQLYLQFNGTTASDYLWEVSQANNTTVTGSNSGGATTKIQIATIAAGSATAGYFASGEFTVAGVNDLTNLATVTGTGSAFTSTSNSYCGVYSGQYLVSGAAITSLLLFAAGGNLAAGSRFDLIGIPG